MALTFQIEWVALWLSSELHKSRALRWRYLSNSSKCGPPVPLDCGDLVCCLASEIAKVRKWEQQVNSEIDQFNQNQLRSKVNELESKWNKLYSFQKKNLRSNRQWPITAFKGLLFVQKNIHLWYQLTTSRRIFRAIFCKWIPKAFNYFLLHLFHCPGSTFPSFWFKDYFLN